MLNPGLSRVEVERQGSDANIILAGGVAAADECVGQIARVQKSLLLDSCRGQELDRLVFDRYGLVRKSAAPCRGIASFTLTAPLGMAASIPQSTVLLSSDGRQFITTQAIVIAAGTTGPVTAAFRSIQAGADQQVVAGAVNSVQTVPAGVNGLNVTNTYASFGASDEEEDDDLKQRARDYYPSLIAGSLPAIRYGALAVPGVKSATAFETIDSMGRPVGPVNLVVADQFTDSLLTIGMVPAYAAQVAALTSEIMSALETRRPCGEYVYVSVAQVVIQQIVLALTFRAGADATTGALKARSAVVAAVNSLAPGQTLTIAALNAALGGVSELQAYTVVSPAGDVAPALLQVIRTSLAYVTTTVTATP
jgi:uncharacterized phage protein gp47/JayE